MRTSITILAILLVIAFAVAACHDNNSNNNSRNTFTEDQFAADPNLKANPETDLIIKFLEPPPTKVILANSRDTGDIGVDEITFSYSRTQEHTICIDNDPLAAHTYQLEGTGIETLTVTMGECMKAVIPPGDYRLRSIHDGQSDRTHTVFVIPNPDTIIEASNKDGFLDKASRFAIRAINFISNNAIEDAHAQTSTLETLISTRRCIGCDLRGTALNFRDFAGVDLTGAKLQNSDMTGSNFVGAELTATNVKNADMTRANFSKADLTVVKNIDTATLEGAKFPGATWLDGECTCQIVPETSSGNINVGYQPINAVHHPTDSTLYVANSMSGTVSALEITNSATTQTVVRDDITVGTIVQDLAISPDGSTLYVLTKDGTGPNLPGDLVVIDTATNQVTDTIAVGDGPFSIVVTPDANTIYFNNEMGDMLIYDTSTLTQTGSISNVGFGYLALTPDGRTLFVTDFLGTTVAVILISTDSVIDTITVANNPGRSVVSARDILYVPNIQSGSVSVIDASTHDVITTINLPTTQAPSVPTSTGATPDGTYIFVTDPGTGILHVIDSFTNTVVANVPLSQSPEANATTFTPDGNTAYISNVMSTTITQIDISSVGMCTGCE